MKMRSVVSAMLALSLACLPLLTQAEEEIPTIVTVVPAPDQTKAERPACFPDPADQYIALPETENFALNKEVISGAHTDVYVSRNVNDGKTDTYWESKGFPYHLDRRGLPESIRHLGGAHSGNRRSRQPGRREFYRSCTRHAVPIRPCDGQSHPH